MPLDDLFGPGRRLDEITLAGLAQMVYDLGLSVDRMVGRVDVLEKMHETARGECVSVDSKTNSVPSGNPDMS